MRPIPRQKRRNQGGSRFHQGLITSILVSIFPHVKNVKKGNMAISVGPPDVQSVMRVQQLCLSIGDLGPLSLLIVSTLSKQKRPILSEDQFFCIETGLVFPVLVPIVPDTLSGVAMHCRDSLTPESRTWNDDSTRHEEYFSSTCGKAFLQRLAEHCSI